MASSKRVFRMVCSRLVQLVVFMTITALGAAIGNSCEDVDDCPAHQFCYDVSKMCANYTNCSQFNRQEGVTNAQNPSQCGPCLQGYASETLATGEEEHSCKKKIQTSEMEDSQPWWIYTAGVAALLCVIALSCFYLRKRVPEGDEKCFRTMGTWKFTPTAPPPENVSVTAYHLQQPFYTDEEPPIYSSVIGNNNNNNNIKERLVNAMPTTPPSWVQVDPSYDEEDGTGNTSGSTAASTTIEVEDEETNPSSWSPENLTVQVPARPFHQFAPEHRDNVLNAVLVRGDCGSNSAPTRESAPEAASENRDGARGGNTYQGPNFQINQTITLNMVKSDN